MKTTLTVREIKEKLSNNDIEKIFKTNGMYINTINSKGDRNNGMTCACNKAKQHFYFHSHILAYHYFLEMNWF